MQACSSKDELVTGSGAGQGDEPAGNAGHAASNPASTTAQAFELAKAAGRPLLVFVVPADPYLQHARGVLLGVYLNRAGRDQMADLALCDIWCARSAELRDRLADGPAIDDTTIAVLIETDGEQHKVVAGEPPAEVYGEDAVRVKSVEARNAFLAERLHAAIAPDLETLKRRSAAACTKAFPKSTVVHDRLDVPDAKLARVVPAWVRLRAETADPASRAAWMQLLADEAIRRWRTTPPPRAKWANSYGCGVSYEGEEAGPGVLCGMSHTPEFSSRFLAFFTEGRG
jgi:hypothetical protein